MTYGGSLGLERPEFTKQRLQSVWPYHLGQLLGTEKVVNLALSGGSNQRIIRTTYDWILSQPKEVLDNTLAVIQITELSRYELFLPRYEGDLNGWVCFKYGNIGPESVRYDINEYHEDYNIKRLSLYSDMTGVYDLAVFCESLASLFTKFNIKYYFWPWFKAKLPQPVITDYIKTNFNFFDSDLWKYETVDKMAELNNEFKDVHPSLNGHKQIAQLMFDSMQ